MVTLDLSNQKYIKLFKDTNLFLPIRWGGGDYYNELKERLNRYCAAIDSVVCNGPDKKQIKVICRWLLLAVEKYQNGFPADAYWRFSAIMNKLKAEPLQMYHKTAFELFDNNQHMFNEDPLNLYRAVRVPDHREYDRKRVFHTPLNMRSKVPTCRYSIAGFPSLYLGTELQLCCEEINYNPYNEVGLASKYKIDRHLENTDVNIEVYELALKPQDFIEQEQNVDMNRRRFDRYFLTEPERRAKYLLWYPLIMSCSFIRANKTDPFAPEYIIPQLLMQWLRKKMSSKNETNQLVGIRYFSCASERASDMGFNYVFPSSGEMKDNEYPFCPKLMKSFYLTKPYYLNNYEDTRICQREMERDFDLKHVDESR